MEPSTERNSFRASTARVDVSDIRAKLLEVGDQMLSRSILLAQKRTVSDSPTCDYDISKHVLDYLPSPIVNEIESPSAEKSKTKKHLVKESSFLGLQKSIVGNANQLRSSVVVGLQNIQTPDIEMDPEFDSIFGPNDMRMLALVSHNNMKESRKAFVIANKNVLKKFRLTGTNTTMTMLKSVFGNDPDIVYGPACKSGPLGGDAQLVAMAVTSQLGGCIFFIDPMDAHPHSADIECLVRQGNVHNILMMNNPSTAHVCMNTLRVALKMGRMEMAPSFFFDLESPSVDAYKKRQKTVLESTISRVSKRMSIVIPPVTREGRVKAAMERATNQYAEYKDSTYSPSAYDDDENEKVLKRKGFFNCFC